MKPIDTRFTAPVKEKDAKAMIGYKTVWNCVLFGEYPQQEIVKGQFDAVSENAVSEGDVAVDELLYERLAAAKWENGVTFLDGNKYFRMNGSDAVSASRHGRHHYRWKDKAEYHYFKFQPIKWRILDNFGGVLTLIADRALDCRKYNDTPGNVTWESCSLRKWLNGEFIDTAFSEDEKKSLIRTKVRNSPNGFYGTDSGADTCDLVYILSNDETFASDTASRYGFYKGMGVDDAAKRFSSTTFAKCRGAWWSPTAHFAGNAFWFMRTNGYCGSNVTYICDIGFIYMLGTESVCDDAGVLPVITVPLGSSLISYAGTVSSTPSGMSFEHHDIPEDAKNGGTREFMEFGRYPQTEMIAAEPFDAVDGYAVEEGDYEVNAALFEKFSSCVWQNDETVINGVRYCRRTGSACENAQHYKRGDEYHYFRFDPIVWRVLRREDGKIFLLSKKSLDCRIFNDSSRHVSWGKSSLRSSLNGEFFNTVFSDEEKKRICEIRSENKDNLFFDAASGEDTVDVVTIPAEKDVFHTPEAVKNGFMPFSYDNDEARKISSTMYSKFMGTWWSPLDDGKGNCFWFLRTSGYNTSNIVYVSECGDILNRGCYASVRDGGIVPMICIKDGEV